VTSPGAGGGRGGRGRGGPATNPTNRSAGRIPDGADTDSNCTDFVLQTAATTQPSPGSGPTPGAPNQGERAPQ
jgi:hypothetical protein